jgi:hypothetical protein
MLLATLTSVALSAIRVGSQGSSSGRDPSSPTSSRGANTVLSFYTAVMLDVMETGENITDPQLRTLYPFISGGFLGTLPSHSSSPKIYIPRSLALPWQQASCMLATQIIRSTRLGKTLVDNFASSISTAIANILRDTSTRLPYAVIEGESDAQGADELLLTLTLLMQHQQVEREKMTTIA